MESPTAVGSDIGLYLYCLFAGPPAMTPERGLEGTHPTCVLSYRDVCALVSRVPLQEYNEPTLNRQLEDLSWLTARVKRHEAIVRAVQGLHPVIPVKFGTIYLSVDGVLATLQRHYQEFRAFLTFIQDKEEWGVKVFASGEPEDALPEASELTHEVDCKRATTTPGAAYFLRKKRASLLRQHVLRRLDDLSHQIYQQVLSWCVEGRRNALRSQRATGKAAEMILNAAFLLAQPEVGSFKHQMDGLAARYASSGLAFELSGPWPPYNFCPAVAAEKGTALTPAHAPVHRPMAAVQLYKHRLQPGRGEAMRQLIVIPIVHTPADLGSQQDRAREAYIARYGAQQWDQHLELLAQLWHTIRQRVLALPVDFTTVRLYQDGLPICGHELAIVDTLAAAGSSNHQLLLELVNRGAILMGTEDPALLVQERERLRQQCSAPPTPGAGEHPPYDTLIAQRDEFIASRIASTLTAGELGLLFIGALHRVTQRLPEDIAVYGSLDAREPSPQVEHIHEPGDRCVEDYPQSI